MTIYTPSIQYETKMVALVNGVGYMREKEEGIKTMPLLTHHPLQWTSYRSHKCDGLSYAL